jgi:hypothetical protein
MVNSFYSHHHRCFLTLEERLCPILTSSRVWVDSVSLKTCGVALQDHQMEDFEVVMADQYKVTSDI